MFDESKPNKESKWYKVKNIYKFIGLFTTIFTKTKLQIYV